MANNVKDMSEKFKSVVELKKYSDDLFRKLEACTQTIIKQKEEIEHLKGLLNGSAPVLNLVSGHNIPPAQLLCEMEILRLQKTAETRALTIEEAKRFDIYNKNLQTILKDVKTDDDDSHKVEFDESSLISIARKGQDE